MKTRILRESNEGPVILWGTFPHRGDELETLSRGLQELKIDREMTLVAYEVADWNGEFSPWALSKEESCGVGNFAGKGQVTLNNLLEHVVPEMTGSEDFARRFSSEASNVEMAKKQSRPIYLLGYSLAGLFSLWAMTQTDLFAGAASCSGSLWYPGWEKHLAQWCETNMGCCEKQGCPSFGEKRFYISLGGKEANSSNSLMASIKNCTDETVRRLKSVGETRFEMNPGGHFTDPGKRLAKAVRWIVEEG